MEQYSQSFEEFLEYIGNLSRPEMVKYFSQIALTLEVNKLEAQHLPDEDAEPLFYKQLDQFGMVIKLARNPLYRGNAPLPDNIGITEEQVEKTAELVLNDDPTILHKLDVMVCVGGIEHQLNEAISDDPWVKKRLLVREYDENGIPVSYKFHDSVEIVQHPKY